MCSQLQSLTLNGVCIAVTWDWNEVEFDHNTANYRVSQLSGAFSLCVLHVGLCNSLKSKYLGYRNAFSSESQIKFI